MGIRTVFNPLGGQNELQPIVSYPNEFDVTLTENSGLTVTLNMNGTKDWGDGTVDTNTTHTYSSYGDYTIGCNGTEILSEYLFGNSGSSEYCLCLINARLSNITVYQNYTFCRCTQAESITIPVNITSIPNYFMYYCSKVAYFIIPNSTQTIGTYAFFYNALLEHILIPSGVNYIGNGAFSSCGLLEDVDFTHHTNVPTLGGNSVFKGVSSACKIYVPYNLYNTWVTSTYWDVYEDIIWVKNPSIINFSNTTGTNIYIYNKLKIGTSIEVAGNTIPLSYYNSSLNVYKEETLSNVSEGSTNNVSIDFSGTKKLTLNTGVSGLTVKFIIKGHEFNAIEETTGNYVINTIGSGIVVDYFISGGNSYMDVENSTTTTNSDITINITMQRATVSTFNRPNLSANGTLGGSSFAVSAEATSNTYAAYKAIDSSTTTRWTSKIGIVNQTKEYVIYNPKFMNITQLVFSYQSTTSRAKTVNIQGGNDGNTWVDLVSSYSGTTTGTLSITNSKYYKYYKIIFTINSTQIQVKDMTFTATEKIPI